ncbi:shikimate kinase [Bacillus badius]|uniref:shikimate kinase n=1 Tax=Bacillus badius TaxID=1455 RepID=UPI002E247AA4|nr:shikimate kinase [Bacillus badius]
MTNIQITPEEKSIVFTGFMGVGKTTIGTLVAEKLSRPFIDIDEEIEKQYQMPVTDIFTAHGENAFREIEKQTVRSFCEQPAQVISLGGGAFMQPEVREICLTHCTVFYLDMSWEHWKDRISLLIDTRPVLQGKSLKEIEMLFYQRKESYAIHHLKLTVDSKSAEEAAEEITDSLKAFFNIC